MTTPTDQHRERANKLAFQLTGDPPHNPGDIAAILAAFAEVDAEAEERGAREQREADARIAESHPYQCDCGAAYQDCDAHYNIAAAIRATAAPEKEPNA